jgi:CRP-like cAMP-binding protein
MSLSPQISLAGNRVLSGLPLDESERLRSAMKIATANLHDVLYRPGDAMQHVYFPLDSAVISLQSCTQDGRSVEIAMLGSESIAGMHTVLGAKVTSKRAIVHVPGSMLRMEVEAFKTEFVRGGVLQHRVLGCLGNLLMEVAQSAACNRVHHLKQRLCRWLLGLHSRARRDQLPVTHETLAQALGTPRSEVTLAAGSLRQSGIIEYTRGCIIIRDLIQLEQTACECFRVVNRTDLLPIRPATYPVNGVLPIPMPMGTDGHSSRTAALRRPYVVHRGV